MRHSARLLQTAALVGIGVGLTANGASAQTPASDLEAITHFFEGANIIAGPAVVDCTLSAGTPTRCFSITVRSEPSTYTPGPWCPTTIEDGPELSGIWLDGGEVYDADGPFIENLAAFYGDATWQLFDPETGEIHVTDSLAACLAAARPDVDPAYRNHCVECLPEYIAETETLTFVIPLEPHPVSQARPTNMAGSGIAFNGVLMDGPAPVDAILGAYTIAPFDDCGGHVNPHAGYHYHAVTDCLNDIAPVAAHGPEIGIAMDGYRIFSHLLPDGAAPADLDTCNGHTVDGLGYHYHAGAPGSNAILGCLSAEYGCHLQDPDAVCDASAPRRGPRP